MEGTNGKNGDRFLALTKGFIDKLHFASRAIQTHGSKWKNCSFRRDLPLMRAIHSSDGNKNCRSFWQHLHGRPPTQN
jgi:hypothetical protein